jgi:predicted acyl esterase
VVKLIDVYPDETAGQSAWFPLYDRNPQTFVANIFFAKPADYHKASQRIYHTANKASLIELPIVTAPSSF